MKFFRITTLTFLLVCCLIAPKLTWAQKVIDIMNKVDSASRQSYMTSIAKVKLSTCTYEIRQGSISYTEKPRILVMESIQKHYGYKNGDTRSMSIILEPSRDKGIGTIAYEYFDLGKDIDTWLYMSAIGKVKRLVTSNEESDGTGSFFGSEFTVEDMALLKMRDYTFNLIGEETCDNRPVWVVEMIPTPHRAKNSKYSKMVSYIDKENYIILKDNLYDRNGKLYKQRARKEIVQMGKIWVPKVLVMNNLVSRRMSDLRIITIAHNMEVPDEFLTQRSLTDFAFRERNLTKLRTYLK